MLHLVAVVPVAVILCLAAVVPVGVVLDLVMVVPEEGLACLTAVVPVGIVSCLAAVIPLGIVPCPVTVVPACSSRLKAMEAVGYGSCRCFGEAVMSEGCCGCKVSAYVGRLPMKYPAGIN